MCPICLPYKGSDKIEHRPWFSLDQYKRLYKATGQYARQPLRDRFRWDAEQLHDLVVFMANTGLRPDEAKKLQHRDVEMVKDEGMAPISSGKSTTTTFRSSTDRTIRADAARADDHARRGRLTATDRSAPD